jgi:hypothetical protein
VGRVNVIVVEEILGDDVKIVIDWLEKACR